MRKVVKKVENKKKITLPIKVIIIGCIIGLVVAGIGGIKQLSANKTNEDRRQSALKASEEAVAKANARLKEIEKEYAEILSLLNRSQKRLKVLESLEKEDKIPSMISKDIHDNSYNISKYLKVLKEYDLVICLNEDDKRYRYYRITPKGKKYLNL